MALIRPELHAPLRRWRDPALAVLLASAGGWIASRGGWILGPLGIAIALVGLGWVRIELRRARFARAGDGPGVVEVDEGIVRYWGAPLLGGEIALRDLVEVRLLRLAGRPHWRLKDRGGQALLVPADAAGAAALADAFAALPGLDLGRLSAALGRAEGPAFETLWTAPDR